jgi:hypothetical protein
MVNKYVVNVKIAKDLFKDLDIDAIVVDLL